MMHDDIKNQILQSALKLADQQPWEEIALGAIATDAGISMADMAIYVRTKGDILSLYGRHIDVQMAKIPLNPDMTIREKLFDLLMERFDAVNQNRYALISILESLRHDPLMASCHSVCLLKSMEWVLECAGVSTAGMKGRARVAGLTALYIRLIRIWMVDDNPDLSKTMAALDQGLNRLDSWAQRLKF